jgi:Glycosyltransferase family 87
VPTRSQIALAVALFLAASMWLYVQRVMIPYQKADATTHDRPRGNLSDLYPRWLGTRELLLHQRDPYSLEVAREIQAGYYGRPIDPTRPGDPKDEQRFAYPVYVVFLLAPTIGLPFPVVQRAFWWFLVLLTAASVWLWLRAISWRPSALTVAILLALTLGSFPAVQGLKLQQLSLLVNGLLALCAVLLTSGPLFLAGAGLAVATIKPQLTAPLVGWLLLWALSDWRKRKQFVFGFVSVMTALLIGAQLILPGWIGEFRQGIAAYRQYTGGAQSALDVLTTPFWGQLLTVSILAALVFVCWRMRRATANSRGFALTISLVLAVTVVVIPMVAPYNQLLLLPAIFLLARDWGTSTPEAPLARFLRIIVEAALFWPWLSAAVLTVASFFLPTAMVQRGWPVPIYTSVGLPLAVVTLLVVHVLPLMRHSLRPS